MPKLIPNVVPPRARGSSFSPCLLRGRSRSRSRPTLLGGVERLLDLLPIVLDDGAESPRDLLKGLYIRLLVSDIGEEGFVPDVGVNIGRGIAYGADERHIHVVVILVELLEEVFDDLNFVFLLPNLRVDL